jgi:hypothetical protein
MPDSDLSRSETADDSGTETPTKPAWWRASVFALDHIWTIVAVVSIGAVALLVAASMLGWNVDVPRPAQIIGLTATVSFLTVGRWIKTRTLELLWDPSHIWVVDLDAQEPRTGGVFRWPSQQFRELEVLEGQLDWLTPNLAVGKKVDLEAGTLHGTWRGTLTDRELLLKIENIKECRGRLEEDAKRGFSIEAQAHSIVRVAAKKAVLRIVHTFERSTLPDDGEALAAEIDDALEGFGVDDHIRTSFDDLEDEMPDDLDDELDAVRNGETNDAEKEASADD